MGYRSGDRARPHLTLDNTQPHLETLQTPRRRPGRNTPAWLPTPAEISQRAAEIREGWTAAQHRQRGQLPRRIQLEPVAVARDFRGIFD